MSEGAPRTADTDQPPVVACTSCGSHDVHTEPVRSAFWQDDRLVVVEDIPALVCGACGERFYDDTTAIMLDLLRGERFPPAKARRELRVPVFSLADRAPPKEDT